MIARRKFNEVFGVASGVIDEDDERGRPRRRRGSAQQRGESPPVKVAPAKIYKEYDRSWRDFMCRQKEEGIPFREAFAKLKTLARTNLIPERTARNWFHGPALQRGRRRRNAGAGRPAALPVDVEAELSAHLSQECIGGKGIAMFFLQQHARQRNAQLPAHLSYSRLKFGRNWYRGFLHRHKRFGLRTPEAVNHANRARTSNELLVTIQNYLVKLQQQKQCMCAVRYFPLKVELILAFSDWIGL